MKLFKKLFGKKPIDKQISQFDTTKAKQLKSAKSIPLEVPTELLHQISTIEEDEIIRQIRIKRQKNEQLFDDNQEKLDKLIDNGKYEAANSLSSFDILGYFEFYQYAQEEEKKENLVKAAEIYWYNIFINGTDAPASFERLLILLRKLKEFEKELVVARVYRNFVHENKHEKINKRIETIKKKIDK